MAQTSEAEVKIKLETINRIIELYPGLKKEKNVIIDAIIGGHRKDDLYDNEMVVDRFEYKGRVLWRNKCGAIIDNNAKFVGVYEYKYNNGSESPYIYHLLEEIPKPDLNKLVVPPYKLG